MEAFIKEIQSDIDETIDLLIVNAEAIKLAKIDPQFAHELEILQSTQESLLARLTNRQSLLDIENKKHSLGSIRKDLIASKAKEYNSNQYSLRRSRSKKMSKFTS